MAWTVNREALAWSAGFFDGEGSTYADPNPRLSVVQNDRRVLDKFNASIGGIGTLGGGTRVYGRAKKPMWNLRVTGWRNVQHVVAMLWPWLSDVKRKQAKTVLLANLSRMAAHPRLGANRDARIPLCGEQHVSGGVASCRRCQRIYERNYEARMRKAG